MQLVLFHDKKVFSLKKQIIVSEFIISMTKLLDADWLGSVQLFH